MIKVIKFSEKKIERLIVFLIIFSSLIFMLIINLQLSVDVKSIFTLFARFLFTLLLKKCFSGFSSDDYPHLPHHV